MSAVLATFSIPTSNSWCKEALHHPHLLDLNSCLQGQNCQAIVQHSLVTSIAGLSSWLACLTAVPVPDFEPV
jgi:hypothetical protein